MSRKSDNNPLDSYSPFSTGLGGFCNMIQIPLEQGWLELHPEGYADLYSVDSEDPVFRFNAEHGEMFVRFGTELASRMSEWEQWKREHPEQADSQDDEPQEHEAEAGPEPKRPEIVKNGQEIQEWMLK